MVRAALIFWLSLFEFLAGLAAVQGLSLLGVRGLMALRTLALAWSLQALAGQRRPALPTLLLMLVPALLLHLAAATIRHLGLNPRRSLAPGSYLDRTIARLDIPLSYGHLPALYVCPHRQARAAVIVAHGSGCNKAFYSWRLTDLLVARGLAVLLIDLDGHGENPRPQRFPDITENISAALAWLRARHQAVGVLGMSLGAAVSLRAAADGAMPDALVLVEMAARLELSPATYRHEALWLLRPASWTLLQDCGMVHLVQTWRESPRIRAEIGTVDLFAALDPLASIRRVTCPLRLVYGAGDAIAPPAQFAELRHAAPPHVEAELVPGESHLTLVLQPAMLRRTADWLAARLAQR